MLNTIKTAALAAIIGVGALAATSASAKADSFHAGYRGDGTGIVIGVGNGWGGPGWDGRGGPRWDGRGGRGWNDHGPRWGGHGRINRFCSEGRAIEKARDMGVRRAHVAWSNRDVVKVRGRKFGHPVGITFSRAPSCPVIGW